MKSLQKPVESPNERERSASDLDGLLRDFFRAQMPEPWPVLKPPATLSLPGGGAAARRPSLFRSRFALAASLLILALPRVPGLPDPLRRISLPSDLESVTTIGTEVEPAEGGLSKTDVDDIWRSAVELYRFADRDGDDPAIQITIVEVIAKQLRPRE